MNSKKNEAFQLDLLSFVPESAALLVSSPKEKQTKILKVQKSTAQFGHVDTDKTFASFCVGNANHFAVEKIRHFISSDQSHLNCLFLSGHSGLGKSHLLHAVANELKLRQKSFYFSSSLAMVTFIESIHQLQGHEYVLIDDLDEIIGNSEAEKVFCQLLDRANTRACKLLITGSLPAAKWKTKDERLKGKLSLAQDIQLGELNRELASQMLHQQAAHRGLLLSEQDLNKLAGMGSRNGYLVERTLNLFQAGELDAGPAEKAAAEPEIKNQKHQVKDLVVEAFDLNHDDLESTKRANEIVTARHLAMFLLREHQQLSLKKIAKLFNKDHSTVMYGIDRIKNRLPADPELASQLKAVTARLKQG